MAQNPATRPIGLSNRKMASVLNQQKNNRAGPWYSSSTRYTQKYEQRSIGALDYEYDYDARTQSPRLTAPRVQLAVRRCGLGPREQEEQRTQRASFVATYHTRVHTEQLLSSSSCGARVLC